ncbi:MAG: immunoglobulin domain-containing protein [Limisphaerales bacterium]
MVSTQPNNVEIGEGEGFSVSAAADGGAPLSYQWFRNGVLIEGATSAEFSIAQAGVADAGNYTVKVTNEAGEILSCCRYCERSS